MKRIYFFSPIEHDLFWSKPITRNDSRKKQSILSDISNKETKRVSTISSRMSNRSYIQLTVEKNLMTKIIMSGHDLLN